MAQTDQNSIDTVVLNFTYSSKDAAKRSNDLIESIFDSDILPELEDVISKTIPKEALFELSKLEIDIGTINEKELSNNLADKMAKAMAEALHKAIKSSTNSRVGGSSTNDSKLDGFLLEALEFYFVKGYFPAWINPSNTMEELMSMALRDKKTQLVQIIFKIGRYEHVTKRLAYGLATDPFDELLLAVDPVNGDWIIDFKKLLLNVKNEIGLSGITSKEFIQNIHFFILRNVFSTESEILIRGKFADNVTKELYEILNLESQLLLIKILMNNIEKDKEYPEISSLWKVLSKSRGEGSSSANQVKTNENTTKEDIIIYGRKIVWHFLTLGHLPEQYYDLTQNDVQKLLLKIIEHKDSFLTKKLQQFKNPEKIVEHLDVLLTYQSKNRSGTTNETVRLDEIIDQLQSSTGGELKDMIEDWKARRSKEKNKPEVLAKSHNTTLSPEIESESRRKNAIYYISILRFYARNGFLPWWSDKTNLNDIFSELGKTKKDDLKHFSLTIEQLEREGPFLRELYNVLPKLQRKELVRLVTGLDSLDLGIKKLVESYKDQLANNLEEKEEHKSFQDWKSVIDLDQESQNNIFDPKAFFKSLYYLDDELFLGRFSNDNPDVVKQIREFTVLAPHFYFRNLSPIRWRKIVYEFALLYYDKGKSKKYGQFHSVFLKHLKKNHPHTDWEAELASLYKITQF